MAPQPAGQWTCTGVVLTLDRAVVMGVLNVTPDSFSDGGLWTEPALAVEHALAMVAAGAGIIDVGGESTRPGASPVTEDEELRRVLPVVAGLRAASDVPISIDTRKPGVAREAVAAGATIVNDTLGEAGEGALAQVAAETGTGLVLMHSRGTPGTMRDLTAYDDVTADVIAWCDKAVEAAVSLGVPASAVAVDPGIGFAKSPAQSLELVRRIDRFVATGYPVVVGTSRKSFIGATLDLQPQERLEATIATVCWSVERGAQIVRVHDVGPVVRAVRMTEALLREENS